MQYCNNVIFGRDRTQAGGQEDFVRECSSNRDRSVISRP